MEEHQDHFVRMQLNILLKICGIQHKEITIVFVWQTIES